MKKIVAVLLTTIITLNASDSFTLRDITTKENFSDVAFRAKADQKTGPGWMLGAKPFGSIMGGWEYVPVVSFPAKMELGNVPSNPLPKISLDVPISLTLH